MGCDEENENFFLGLWDLIYNSPGEAANVKPGRFITFVTPKPAPL